MDCVECKGLLSSFMDNELDCERADAVRCHLAVCGDCALLCEELAAMLDVCALEAGVDLLPPNSKAIWCRINNLIECENKPEPAMPAEQARRPRFWQVSLWQATAAVLAIGLISSLLTAVALHNLQPADNDLAIQTGPPSIFQRALAKIGLAETPYEQRERRIKQHIAAIEYWNARVEARRQQWDRQTRDAFDRNLQVIDETVSEYKHILERDPDDDLSREMLDAVLSEKTSLLRDFSDL
jgi:uncharacterized protein YukE